MRTKKSQLERGDLSSLRKSIQILALAFLFSGASSSAHSMCAEVFSKISQSEASEIQTPDDQSGFEGVMKVLVQHFLEVAGGSETSLLVASQKDYLKRLEAFMSNNAEAILQEISSFGQRQPKHLGEDGWLKNKWTSPLLISLVHLRHELDSARLSTTDKSRLQKNIELVKKLMLHENIDHRTLFYFLGPGLLGKHWNNLRAANDDSLDDAKRQEKLGQFFKAFEELNYLRAYLSILPNHRLMLPIEFHLIEGEQLAPSYDVVAMPKNISEESEYALFDNNLPILISGKEPAISSSEDAFKAIIEIAKKAIADIKKNNGNQSKAVFKIMNLRNDGLSFSEVFPVQLSLQVDFEGLGLDPQDIAEALSLNLPNLVKSEDLKSRPSISLIDKNGSLRAVIVPSESFKNSSSYQSRSMEWPDFKNLVDERDWLWLDWSYAKDHSGEYFVVSEKSILNFVNYVHHSKGYLRHEVGKELGKIKKRLTELEKNQLPQGEGRAVAEVARGFEKGHLEKRQALLREFLKRLNEKDFGKNPDDFKLDGIHIIDFLNPKWSRLEPKSDWPEFEIEMETSLIFLLDKR